MKKTNKPKNQKVYSLVCDCCNLPMVYLATGGLTVFAKKKDADRERVKNYSKDVKTHISTLTFKK